jgi:hypothetical protein
MRSSPFEQLCRDRPRPPAPHGFPSAELLFNTLQESRHHFAYVQLVINDEQPFHHDVVPGHGSTRGFSGEFDNLSPLDGA